MAKSHIVPPPGSQPIADAIPQAQIIPGQHDGQRRCEPNPPPSSPEATDPPAVPDLWRKALDKLDKDTRQKLQMDGSEQNSVQQQVADLVNAAKEKQQECEDKRWKFSIGDRDIILRDYAATMVSYLTQLGNIAMPFAPPKASPIWSAIKVVLQIPVIEAAQMCALLMSTDKIVRIVDRGQAYESVYKPETGTGKTCLTSKVIDHVRDTLKTTSNHEGFAYFYCDRNDPVRRQPLSIFQSYVRQLSTITGQPQHMQVKLRTFCNNMEKNGSDLDFDSCKQLILNSVNLYPKTTLVLDALDECEPDLPGKPGRQQLVRVMEDLLSKSERPLKIFISSRPDHDIQTLFTSRANIEIRATNNQGDIEKFLDEHVKKDSWSEPLIKEIKQKLLDGSSGMFQWVYLQVNQILSCVTEEAARNRLGGLPPDLETAYTEIYDKIKKRDENDRVLAERAFMWVMSACTPLSREQLLSAIRVNPDLDAIDLASTITAPSLLDLCNNLLVLDSQQDVWRFSHLSVAEYFEKNHWDLVQSHYNAAKVCLKLLIETYKTPNEKEAEYSSDEYESEQQNILNPAHPFQLYTVIVYFQRD
ncbi:hypothetical protein DV737_g5777, partial [Chaetothyriales sp. CBS 132003]